jgi:hypothetical protein
MKIKIINSWKEFRDIIEVIPYTDYIFRGQGHPDWELQSSFFRACSEMKPTRPKKQIEDLLLTSFKAKSHQFLQHLPEEKKRLEWASVMQHYGAVTKLLDWSHSPFIALFFALISSQESVSIFQLNYKEITEQNKINNGLNFEQLIIKDMIDNKIIIHQPTFQNQRIIAQQGLFTYNSSYDKNIQTVLSNYDYEYLKKSGRVFSKNEEILTCGETPVEEIESIDNNLEEDSILTKYIFRNIDNQVKKEIYNNLKMMNIHFGTLFPDIEGLCRSLKFKMLEKDFII